MEDYERVILVKSDVFIFKIPPRTTNRAYRLTTLCIKYFVFHLNNLNICPTV